MDLREWRIKKVLLIVIHGASAELARNCLPHGQFLAALLCS